MLFLGFCVCWHYTEYERSQQNREISELISIALYHNFNFVEWYFADVPKCHSPVYR
jgi:hypothetical protein